MSHIDPVESMFITEEQEAAPYPVEVLGEEYIVLSGVFSPKVRRNSSWFAEKIPPLISGKNFLEIGAGAGVLAVRCAKLGYEVVATDISADAVSNITLNAKKHGVTINTRHGSVFEPISKEEKFDTIFWNHPWIYTDTEVDPERQASYDKGYLFLEEFLRQGKDYLSPKGCILLGTGSLARIDLIQSLAQQFGYHIELVMTESQPLEVGGNDSVDFMIYRLIA